MMPWALWLAALSRRDMLSAAAPVALARLAAMADEALDSAEEMARDADSEAWRAASPACWADCWACCEACCRLWMEDDRRAVDCVSCCTDCDSCCDDCETCWLARLNELATSEMERICPLSAWICPSSCRRARSQSGSTGAGVMAAPAATSTSAGVRLPSSASRLRSNRSCSAASPLATCC